MTRLVVESAVRSAVTGLRVGFRGVGVVGSAARTPGRVVASLSRALRALDDIAVGVEAMHGEFVGMRADIVVLDQRVEGLRQEIVGFRSEIGPAVAEVPPMRGSVEALDGRLEALTHKLDSVDALALRLGSDHARTAERGERR